MGRIVIAFLSVVPLLSCDQAPNPSRNGAANNANGSTNNANLVWSVSADVSRFARVCESHADCVLVPTSYLCFSRRACDYGAVLAENEAAALEALENEKSDCSDPGDFSGANSFTTGGCEPPEHVACDSGTCKAVDCVNDADCGPSESGLVSCYPDFVCRECMDGGSYAQSDCPDGMYCWGSYCRDFDRCATGADCPEPDIIGRRLGCVDGFCRPCKVDDDCAADAVCTLNSVPLGGCYEKRLIDESCLNGTCPSPCRQGPNCDQCAGQIGWECPQPDPYPGVDFPELSDFDTSCSGDADCAAVALRRWTKDCVCSCYTAGVNVADQQSYADAWPDTKTLFGCQAEPDCPCEPTPIVCGADNRCVPR